MGAFTPLPSSTVVEATGEIVVNIPAAVVYKREFDETVPDVMYVGEAAPGTASSSASWRVKKITATNVLYAGTGAFDQVWNDRAGLIYN